MAVQVLQDALILYGPVNASGDQNQVKLDQKIDMLESTVFGHTEHRFVPGLRYLTVDGSGFAQFDDSINPKAIDFQLFSDIGATERAFTVGFDKTDGQVAWLGKSVSAEYSPELPVADLAKFGFNIKANRFTKGKVVYPLALRSGAGPGTGTIYNMGALSATQKMLIAVHVVTFTGTTLTINVKSNDTNDTVSPTVRASQAGIVGTGAFYFEVAGPITDTFWYVDFSFTGTNFTAAVSIGIR